MTYHGAPKMDTSVAHMVGNSFSCTAIGNAVVASTATDDDDDDDDCFVLLVIVLA